MTLTEVKDVVVGYSIDMTRRYRKKDSQRRPPPITAKVLRESAVRYLDRYAPSVEQFRRVLIRKVDKTIRERGEGSRQEALILVEEEIQRRIAGGELHDQRVAEDWTAYLHRQGKSVLQIRGKLYQKGISTPLINAAISTLQEERTWLAFDSAVTYARKRRFGPFRATVEERKLRQQKDIASMLRAGHSYAVVREIIDCLDLDELELLIQERE